MDIQLQLLALQKVVDEQARYIRQLEADKTFYIQQLKLLLNNEGEFQSAAVPATRSALAAHVPAGWTVSKNTSHRTKKLSVPAH